MHTQVYCFLVHFSSTHTNLNLYCNVVNTTVTTTNRFSAFSTDLFSKRYIWEPVIRAL